MVNQITNTIHVKYHQGSNLLSVGNLAYRNRKIYFEYDNNFLNSGLELSPFKLPLKAGLMTCEERIFDGLFGVFNDSLPDGWGRLLLDRKLMKLGINPGDLTPLDRLKFVGSRGMGALTYEPEHIEPSSQKFHEDLDVIAEECFQFQTHEEDQFIDELLIMNGSSAGARPKILISLLEKKHFVPTNNNGLAPRNDWIIKLSSSLDPKDIGPIEYAYHLMATEAGLNVPEAKLFQTKRSVGYFGVKRFDRQEFSIKHMHTMSGLVHADHRIPSLDYQTIMKATLWLTKDVKECEAQYRNAVFNVLSHNRDDHSKNFSFLMDETGKWSVSPAYDLTFSSGPAGEHCTTIMGEGKNPEKLHLLKLAEVISLDPKKAIEIINEVKEAVLKWPIFAKKVDVSKISYKNIQAGIDRVLKNF